MLAKRQLLWHERFMSVSSLKVLRLYTYDPLDRLTGAGLLEPTMEQRFYQEDHLVTELGPRTQRTFVRHQAQPLAQQQSEGGVTQNQLLATDQAHSLLQTLTRVNPRQFAHMHTARMTRLILLIRPAT